MRSTFVNVVAWVFIVLGGFATLIALLQNIMITLFFPVDEMRQAMGQAEKTQAMPPGFRFVFEYVRFFFVAFLALSVVTLTSAIGLLRRRNWARLAFIGVMAVGILWNLVGLVMLFFMTSWMPPVPDTAPAEFKQQFDVMMKVIAAVNVVVALGVTALFGWIIKRLVSEEIRREFVNG